MRIRSDHSMKDIANIDIKLSVSNGDIMNEADESIIKLQIPKEVMEIGYGILILPLIIENNKFSIKHGHVII